MRQLSALRLVNAVIYAALTVCAISAWADPLNAPPVTPIRPVTNSYFGTQVIDDYRYLENLNDPEVQRWMRAQSNYSRATLDRLPGRRALLDRIHSLANADTRRGGFIRRGQRYFYELIEPGAQQPKLVYRDGIQGAEHPLVDPSILGNGSATHYELDYYVPSWDGGYVAYGISSGGSEASELHVMEVASGKVLQEAITRTSDNVITWRPNSRSFFYLRYVKPTPDTPASQTEYNARAYLHTVGANPDGDRDPVVFGRGVSQSLEVPEGQGTYVIGGRDSAYLIAAANHNMDENPSTLYIAPLDKVSDAATPWRKLANVDDGITQIVLHGETLYFLSLKGASHFRILATSLRDPDVKHPRIIVPEGSGVITDFDVAADGLYYRERDGAASRLMRVSLDGKQKLAVPLPFEGNVFGPITDDRQAGALFDMQSWSRPPQIFIFDPASMTRNSGLVPASKIDTSQLESKEIMVTSYDGTRIPLSIVYKRGAMLDGSHPTILEGYGNYGLVIESSFDASMLAWIERGGVWAIAHVRGGGEFGEDWHRAGQMRSKLNTVFDFIACGRYLVDQHYTSTKLLAANGASAGGITVGGAMTWRPDLFAVVLDQVGISDTLRSETEPNGPPNISEFGSVKTEDGFHDLYAMSPYEHVRDGTAYPAVMFLTGANDPRVAPWHMLKMTARVQAATASHRPVLLRIDFDAGHGIGSNRSQREQERADMWSFALWQMGDRAFQPARSAGE